MAQERKASNEAVSNSWQRRIKRYKARKAQNIPPSIPCKRCGASFWESDSCGGWFCFICSNRGAWVNGEFVQGSRENDNH